jgi:hypothetical protein
MSHRLLPLTSVNLQKFNDNAGNATNPSNLTAKADGL